MTDQQALIWQGWIYEGHAQVVYLGEAQWALRVHTGTPPVEILLSPDEARRLRGEQGAEQRGGHAPPEGVTLPPMYPITVASVMRGERPCLLCGQPLGTPRYEVHLAADGQALIDVEAPEGEDSLGWFDIGSSCARQVPAAYVRRIAPTSQA